MIYRDKYTDIRVEQTGGKVWSRLRVRTADCSVLVSFEQLHAIIQQIAHCERQKYPTGGKAGRDPAVMVQQFCQQAAAGVSYAVLRARFDLPEKAATADQPPIADADAVRWESEMRGRLRLR